MKSGAAGLTWEYWKGGWPYVLGAVPVGLGMVGLISAIMLRLNFAGQSPPPQTVNDMFHPVFYATLFITVALMSMAAGGPELRFTLPMNSWTLVTWPLLNGVVATVGTCLIFVLTANKLLHTEWPIVKPTIAAGCLFVICHGLNWTIQCGREGRLALAVLLALIGGVLVACWCQVPDEQVALQYWKQTSLMEIVIVVGLVSCAYFAAIAGVTSSRRGQPLSVAELGNFLSVKLDWHRSPSQGFTSSYAAQRWLEWSEKGLAVPIGAAAVVGILFFQIAWVGIRSTEIVQLVFPLLVIQIVAAWPLGFYLGSAGPQFGVREFTAVRPLSDTALADVVLWNTARSFGWGWLVWWVGVLFCFLYAAGIGAAPQSPTEFFPGLRPGSWSQVAFYIVLGMAGSLLAGWTVVSLGVSWILVRQWMFHTLLLIGSGIPVALSICALFEVAPESWDWIQGGLIGLLFALNLSLYVAAYCRRLIGWRRISTVGIFVVVLFTCTAMLVPQLPEAHRNWALAWLLALSPLPCLAFAAAPLALSWTRRR